MSKAKKIFSLILAIISVSLCCFVFCGCEDYLADRFAEFWNSLPPIKAGFKYKWKQTEDGFSYYVDENIGLCIMEFPSDQDEITIPEYIDGMKVMQIGAIDPNAKGFDIKEYGVNSAVKKLTITHRLNLYGTGNKYDTMFHLIETIIFVDCWSSYVDIVEDGVARIEFFSHDAFNNSVHPEIHLVCEKGIEADLPNITTIEIPKCVTVIEAGVFDGLSNVVIKVESEEKPEGWQENWNSGLPVEWGAEI